MFKASLQLLHEEFQASLGYSPKKKKKMKKERKKETEMEKNNNDNEFQNK